MSSSDEPPNLSKVKLFYRTNEPHRPEEFGQDPLPTHIDLDIPMTCTVKDLSELIVNLSENILPSPSVGTRLVFRTMDQSLYTMPPRAKPGTKPKFIENHYGSYVIGRGHPGIELPAEDENDPASTKQKPRWLEGAYIACTIIPPPIEKDISVATTLPSRNGRGSGLGEIDVRRSGTPATRRGADHPAKGIVVGGDRARGGKGRDGVDEDHRPPRRNNARVSKGTSRGPSSRTRDSDRRDN
ncbi:hypothetical protein QBC41DRAFT_298023 [Cercophora samala]|uniref:Uncharacterized protein n=1 Tax=Cercophora samala TaxID=330535 RepID=A0AA39ZNG5_9PEZI|nr:hypothetical protein QBC41DRAFT_298023 [Cercophora samala]